MPSNVRAAFSVSYITMLLSFTASANASNVAEVMPLTDKIIMVHFNDGYVIHHKKGDPRTKETVITDPLDLNAAQSPRQYSVDSLDDPEFKQAVVPLKVGRKSKGTDFAWFIDKWENNRAVNTRPDHTSEHWLYLVLPKSLQTGKTYTVHLEGLAKNGNAWKLPFDLSRARSEAVHVNTLGYVPSSPAKYAYVYHWAGDLGALDLKPYAGRPFYLIEATTGKPAFEGKLKFRAGKDSVETGQRSNTPGGNFQGADVYECDFSAFNRPGHYVVAVEGIGCSWAFRIDPDVYRSAFRTVIRGLYHNRSGIALKQPYTEFVRPAPHNPKLTPGFADKLRYTNVRWQEWGSEGGDAKKLMAESPGNLNETWGWYQDAGDWDSYETHLRVAQELLTVYEMAPQKFKDNELNIPESGNGVPDILDEAAWLPRFCHRLRKELLAKKWGTGGIGLRVAGDAFGTDEGTKKDGSKVGRGSWEDTDRIWMVSGEDPWATYRYAGVAAQLAYAYQLGNVKADPDGVDWAKEARECYTWAKANTRTGDEDKENGSLKIHRAYAAACLFRLTGDKEYEAQFIKDTADITPDTQLRDERRYAPFVYALGGGKAQRDPAALARIRSAVLKTADDTSVATLNKRALRWGGDFNFPMLVGQQTTPLILEAAVAYTLTKQSDAAKANQYLAALYTTCDYFLGTNPLNQTWVTGLGPRFPMQMFHMDSWYNGLGKFSPGLIPYGPWLKSKDEGQGPWDSDWANPTAYPAIDKFPGSERWFSNRCSPLSCEFTIHQNTAPTAAIFGFLCEDKSAPRTTAQITAQTKTATDYSNAVVPVYVPHPQGGNRTTGRVASSPVRTRKAPTRAPKRPRVVRTVVPRIRVIRLPQPKRR